MQNDYKILDGDPEYKIYDTAYYFPQYKCLFDKKGRRIDESCVRRGVPLEIVGNIPKKIDIPTFIINNIVNCLYLGSISQTFGHFLTEGLSRVWFLFNHPELSEDRYLVYHPKFNHADPPPLISETFKHIPHSDSLIAFNQPIRLHDVIVPNPSFSNRSQGYAAHKIIFEHITETRINTEAIISKKACYLSRARLSKDRRKTINESQIEKLMIGNGVDVIHPQELPFQDQLKMINRYQIAIGCIGAAFHSILFRLDTDNFKTVIFHSALNENYNIIDGLKGIDSKYINALRKDPLCKKSEGHQNLIADIDMIKKTLKEVLSDNDSI